MIVDLAEQMNQPAIQENLKTICSNKSENFVCLEKSLTSHPHVPSNNFTFENAQRRKTHVPHVLQTPTQLRNLKMHSAEKPMYHPIAQCSSWALFNCFLPHLQFKNVRADQMWKIGSTIFSEKDTFESTQWRKRISGSWGAGSQYCSHIKRCQLFVFYLHHEGFVQTFKELWNWILPECAACSCWGAGVIQMLIICTLLLRKWGSF